MKLPLPAVIGTGVLIISLWIATARYGSWDFRPSYTPKRQWASAQLLYEERRPDITVRKLREYVEKDPALRERARIWRSILLVGMSRTYLELAVIFKEGAHQNPDQSALFYVRAQDCQTLAREYSQELDELIADRSQWLNSSSTVLLDFGMPDPPDESPVTLVSIAQGSWPGQREAGVMTQNAVIRAILEETMKITGARSVGELAGQLSRRPFAVPKANYLAALPAASKTRLH
jgi:hypothetical protein